MVQINLTKSEIESLENFIETFTENNEDCANEETLKDLQSILRKLGK